MVHSGAESLHNSAVAPPLHVVIVFKTAVHGIINVHYHTVY